MASADLKVPISRDWVLANPWFWMAIGLSITALAWGRILLLDSLMLEDSWPVLQFFLIGAGLLSVGGALRIRLGSTRPAFLESTSPAVRDLVLLGLFSVYGLMALTVTALLILRIAGVDPFFIRPNKLVILWFIATPMSVVASQLMFRKRDPSWKLSATEESSALLALAALACFFSCRALYLGESRAAEWDSIRLLLAVMALVAIVAAPLVVVPQKVRRGVVSLLILLHFGGIATAVLAAEPAPWIIQQIWVRIYRPYLEFMYLNNAYHFYAPDPGPARYLWFRLIYEDGNGKEVGHWLKIPEFDARGRHNYALGLQYSRYMAMTENTVSTMAPTFFDTVEEKEGKDKRMLKVVPARFLEERLRHAPDWQPKVGEPLLPKGSLIIPFHPWIPRDQQYVVPSYEVKNLLESFAHHVTRMLHPKHPDYKILGVKIYSVVHNIPTSGPYLSGVHPADPEFFRPTFMGEYRFTDKGDLLLFPDPFLYWVLPITREYFFDTKTVLIGDYCRKHAGDPRWVQRYRFEDKWTPSIEWIEP